MTPPSGSVGQPRSPVERLLQRARPHQARRLTGRELRVEAVVAALFLLLAVGAPFVWPSDRGFDPLLAVALVLSHALAARIRVFLGAGCAMPTQLVIVPMLFLMPVATVPLLVAGGLMLAAASEVVCDRAHPERLLTAVADAWHVIGSTLVLGLAGEPDLVLAAWPVITGALVAQCGADLLAATVREWLGRGIAPTVQMRVIASVQLIDVCLTPIGMLAALAGTDRHLGFLVVLPLLALLGAFASDRRARIGEVSRRLDELREERGRLDTAIRRIGDAFASKLDRAALADLALRTTVEALNADHGRAVLAAQTIEVSGAHAVDRAAIEAVVDAVRAHGRQQSAADERGCFAIAHPLTRGSAEAPSDVLVVTRHGQGFSDHERGLFGHLAAQAQIAMENVGLHDRLHREATTDELTGLANHRRFQEILRDEAARGRRAAQPVALVMFDIDNFKSVNDVHGHQQGDAVLRAVAQAVASAARATDKPARYGGEELAVVLPDTDLEGGVTAAETMRRAVEALRVPLGDGSALRVTVSAGVSASSSGFGDPGALMAAADSALYEAKRSGKNRTVRGRRPAGRFNDRVSHASHGRP